MSRYIPVAAAAFGVCMIAQQTVAQDAFGTALTLGYNAYSGDGALDADGGTLQIETDMVFGAVSLDTDVSFDKSRQDGEAVSILSTEFLPKYWFTPDFGAGIYLARDSIDLDLGDRVNLDSYGVEGTYRTPRFEASAFAGRTDLDELAGDVDVRDIGLRARFEVTPQFAVFGNGVHSNFDGGGGDVNANTVGLGAQYDFGNGLAVFGGHQNASVEDLDGDLNATSLGMNYGLNAGGRPVVLSGEYARIHGDALGSSADADRFSLSATVLLGDARSKRIPGNAVTSSLLKSDRNAIAGLLSGIGF